jgi:hypothetical protein
MLFPQRSGGSSGASQPAPARDILRTTFPILSVGRLSPVRRSCIGCSLEIENRKLHSYFSAQVERRRPGLPARATCHPPPRLSRLGPPFSPCREARPRFPHPSVLNGCAAFHQRSPRQAGPGTFLIHPPTWLSRPWSRLDSKARPSVLDSQEYRGRQWLAVRRKKKRFMPSIRNKPNCNFFVDAAKGSITMMSRITRCITNHVPTGEYRQRFFPDKPTHCNTCGTTFLLSRSHILTRCPNYMPAAPSIKDWQSAKHNDALLFKFLTDNPVSFSFDGLPPDVP